MTEPLFQFYACLSDSIPVSVNAMYTIFRGRMVLKKQGQAFKSALTRIVASTCAALPWAQAIDAVYNEKAWVRITVIFYAPDWLNKSWKPGATTEKQGRQSPYKKKDAPNYLKVIEDAVAEGTGIDDSAHFETSIKKRSGEPCIEIAYEVFPWPPN
jgi:Holliday junction resolvase RusA-like endonuclease